MVVRLCIYFFEVGTLVATCGQSQGLSATSDLLDPGVQSFLEYHVCDPKLGSLSCERAL